jgi:glycosyltransferase involved in cell wall biosynthesis
MSVPVLYIVGSFKSGGTETQLLEMLRRIDRTRYMPHVLCFRREGGLLAEVEKLDVELREMGIDRFMSPSTFTRLRAHAAWAAARGIRIIQGFHFHGSFYGALLKRDCPGSRLLACEQAIYGPRAVAYRLAQQFYHRHTDVFIANCEAVKRALLARAGIDPARVVILYGGVDTERYRPRARDGRSAGPLIGLVARLHPDKGQMLLLEAAPAIFRALPDARIIMAGDGPQRGEIEARIRALALDGRIDLLGDRRDIPDLLATMDLLVLPSASEGFANAALEGSASGLPVVVSDVGGNPEIVLDRVTGRVFPSGNPERLAECVIGLLREPETGREAGLAGRRRVEEMFPLDEMVRRHEDLYDAVLAGRNPARAASPFGGNR